MTTFDWPLLLSSSSGRAAGAAQPPEKAPGDSGPPSSGIQEMRKDTEVVYKDLYIKELYRYFLSTNFISYVYTV